MSVCLKKIRENEAVPTEEEKTRKAKSLAVGRACKATFKSTPFVKEPLIALDSHQRGL